MSQLGRLQLEAERNDGGEHDVADHGDLRVMQWLGNVYHIRAEFVSPSVCPGRVDRRPEAEDAVEDGS